MKNSLVRLGSIGALALLCAGPLAAQNAVNCSDCPNNPVTGIYAPGPMVGGVPSSFIAGFSTQLSTGSVTSPINGSTISAATGTAILALLNGSSGGLAAVQAALNAAGAPTAETARLMTALNGVGGGNRTISRAEIRNITAAFNAMVNASTGAFLGGNSPMLLGIHATVLSLVNAAGMRSA